MGRRPHYGLHYTWWGPEATEWTGGIQEENQTTVNKLKTKVVIFGKQMDLKLTYKQNVIEQVVHSI